MRALAERLFHSSPTPNLQILCDFDGTITPFDVTDALLTAFAPPSWEAIERDWVSGLLTARQCMAAQVALLTTEQHTLDAFLDDIPLAEGFKDFIEACAVSRIPVTIVSDGIDYAIRRVLSRHGLAHLPVVANALRGSAGTGFGLDFPYSTTGCPSGVCKCVQAKKLKDKGISVVLIGDGRTDCCVAGEADFVLARRNMPLHAHCLERACSHQPFDTFHDVIRLLALA